MTKTFRTKSQSGEITLVVTAIVAVEVQFPNVGASGYTGVSDGRVPVIIHFKSAFSLNTRMKIDEVTALNQLLDNVNAA